MYYNWRTIDGYRHYPVKIVIAPRGIGKTFGRVLKCVIEFLEHQNEFVYVVENKEMVQELCKENGLKFFQAINTFSEEKPSYRKSILENLKITELTEDEVTKRGTLIKGGIVKINKTVCGHIIALSDFANLKRNNFSKSIKTIIVDEFIPEKINVTHLDMPRKLVSIIESVSRLNGVKIYLLANSIRPNDIILDRLGLVNLKSGEIRKIKDKYGPFIVCHYVDPKQYTQFNENKSMSVSGRIATIMKEDKLNTNTFNNADLNKLLIGDKRKQSSHYLSLHNDVISVRFQITKDKSTLYCLYDYGENETKRYCVNEQYQNGCVRYNNGLKEVLMIYYTSNKILFESISVLEYFKTIIGLK